MKHFLAGSSVFCVILSLAGHLQCKTILPYYLKEQYARPLIPDHRSFVVDIDKDGNDDLFIDRGVALTHLIYRGRQFVALADANYDQPGQALGFCDATGDGRPEFFVYTDSEEDHSITVYNWFAQDAPSSLYTIGPFLPSRERGTTKSEGRMNLMPCLDADRDGRPELYIGINSFYAEPEPRSLRVYDGNTGGELWRFVMGPQTVSVVSASTSIGPLVALSTFACDNGAVWNGTADSLSYVFCFRPDGELLWRRETTGKSAWNSVDVIDRNGDGMDEFLVSRLFGPAESDSLLPSQGEKKTKTLWAVAILDPRDGSMIDTAFLDTGVSDVYPVDIDDDGSAEVLAVGTNGKFYMLESDLSVESEWADRLHLQPANQSIFGVLDLNDDGKREIVVGGVDRVLVRSADGSLLAEEVADWPYIVELATVESATYVVIQSKNVVTFYTLEKLGPILPLMGTLALVLLCAAIGGGGLIGVYSLKRWMKRRQFLMAYLDEAQQSLLVAMTAFGHGGSSSQRLDRIRFYLTNWDRMRVMPEGTGKDINDLLGAYTEEVIPDLRQIVFLARKAKVPSRFWKAIVQSAVHGEKCLAVLFRSESAISPDIEQKALQEAVQAFDALDGSLSSIRAHLRGIYNTTLLPALGRVISEHEKEFSAMALKPRINVLGAYDTMVFISASAFSKILDGIINNALRAMEKRAAPELEITLKNEGAYCTVDVRDNGMGIVQEDWERIFERSYTTKREGGFGLYYAREELAKYGGKIFVSESRPSGGTTMSMILRQAS